MKVGSFATLDRIERLHQTDADFFELFSFNSFALLTDAEFTDLRREFQHLPMRPGAFAGLVPGDLKLVGPELDLAAADQYFRTLFSRIEQLAPGPTVATLGSAGARMVPDGYDYQDALADFAHVVRSATTIARDHGVTLTVEQLNSQECNFLTTLDEVGTFLQDYELTETGLTLDLFHMMEEGEPFSVIGKYSDLVRHVHIADTDRDGPGKGQYPFVEFFTELKKFNYSGDISIEAFWKDFHADADLGINTTIQALNDAGFTLDSPS